MIITRLAGGLGNQMFHYAIARSYLKNKNDKVYLDDYLLEPEESDIEKINQRPYALNIFRNLKGKRDQLKISNLLRNGGMLNRLRRLVFFKPVTIVEQKLMEQISIPDPKNAPRHLRFIGNFQSERYFKGMKDQLIKDFEFPDLDPSNEAIRHKISITADSVSIHIRRGDYLSSSNKNIFTSVNLNYYDNAIRIMLDKLQTSRLNAFIFTDDPEWVRANFIRDEFPDAPIISGNISANSWKDMALMTSCKHHIIANSSFSWWGAWLSKYDGVNIAPRHWYLPNSYEFDITDIVPEGWIIANYDLETKNEITKKSEQKHTAEDQGS